LEAAGSIEKSIEESSDPHEILNNQIPHLKGVIEKDLEVSVIIVITVVIIIYFYLNE
jgi:hypothetical protein